jgi:hypothetical protein
VNKHEGNQNQKERELEAQTEMEEAREWNSK